MLEWRIHGYVLVVIYDLGGEVDGGEDVAQEPSGKWENSSGRKGRSSEALKL